MCPACVMIGTPVDTALSLSARPYCSFNCAALQGELHWGGTEGVRGYFCIFLFAVSEQWSECQVCQGLP